MYRLRKDLTAGSISVINHSSDLFGGGVWLDYMKDFNTAPLTSVTTVTNRS